MGRNCLEISAKNNDTIERVNILIIGLLETLKQIKYSLLVSANMENPKCTSQIIQTPSLNKNRNLKVVSNIKKTSYLYSINFNIYPPDAILYRSSEQAYWNGKNWVHARKPQSAPSIRRTPKLVSNHIEVKESSIQPKMPVKSKVEEKMVEKEKMCRNTKFKLSELEKMFIATKTQISSLYLNGIDNYVCIPPIKLGLFDITISFFIKPQKESQPDARIFEIGCYKDREKRLSLSFCQDRERLVLECENNKEKQQLCTHCLFPASPYCNIAIQIATNGCCQIYMDGYLTAESIFSNYRKMNTDYFFIGRSITDEMKFFLNGNICGFKLYKSIIPIEELKRQSNIKELLIESSEIILECNNKFICSTSRSYATSILWQAIYDKFQI